jgi:uncharacterized protein
MDIKTWLNDKTIYITLAGSRAYGLETPESDWDYRGACIPPADYYMGMFRFEQADSKETMGLIKPLMGEFPVDNAEITIWSLQKMIGLASEGNPNMIELMFMDPTHIIHCDTDIMEPFFDIRKSFLSKLLKHRFSGYAMAQLKRIRNHKHWIDNPPKRPTREDYGIEGVVFPKDQLHACDKLIELQVETWLVDQTHLPEDIKIQLGPEMIRMINAILEQIQIEVKIDRLKDILERAANRHLGFADDFILFLNKFKRYRADQANYKSWETWKAHRNPARAKLEEAFGIDTKHSMHLVRLLHMCEEILTKEEVNVNRKGIDDEELKAIRYKGAVKYEDLVDWAEKKDKELDEIMEKSSLPKSPNKGLISQTLTDVTMKYLNGYYKWLKEDV